MRKGYIRAASALTAVLMLLTACSAPETEGKTETYEIRLSKSPASGFNGAGLFYSVWARLSYLARSERMEEPSNQRDGFGYKGSDSLSKSRKERKEAEAKYGSEAVYLLSRQQDEIRA